ncbi:ABC transporter permease [Rhizobium sp. G187]|uniref:ABC transporter permease n=1 Tax=Rhizobium sp. G187 TaxID=3451352 RepID=UPI003EE6AC3F
MGFLGIALFAGLWEVAGQKGWFGMAWPPLSSVVMFMASPQKQALLAKAALATTTMVAIGYAVGASLGMLAAVLVHFVTALRPGMDRFASLLHSIPTIALAPIFIVLTSRDYTGTAIAGISVFFVSYVAMTSGLSAAPQAGRDLFAVLGAGKGTRFLHYDLPTALPTLLDGLSYAVPMAFIGVILGEWFGASRGIGLLMVSAMQNFQIPMLWSAVLVTSLLSLAAYAAMSQIQRWVQRLFR